jgi:hypothetical protein
MRHLTKLWALVALAAATTAHARAGGGSMSQQNSPMQNQGHEMCASQMTAGYSAPARIDLRGSYDFFAQGSFTYWQPMQDNMELGFVTDTAIIVHDFNGNFVNADTNYKPGFKVAGGVNFEYDDWDSRIEYTWFRGSHKTTTQLDSVASSDVRLLPLWVTPAAGGLEYYSGNLKWRLNMDILDWELARSYYSGTRLTIRPFYAVRALWMRQRAEVNYTEEHNDDSNMSVVKKAQSWAVGPRVGAGSNWLFGRGFRTYGNVGADLLFTQYRHLNTTQISTTAAGLVQNGRGAVAKQRRLNLLRTHMDIELGLGWGSYFQNERWHFDLSAGYGFQVFFNQNMFRKFFDDINFVDGLADAGNLYIHGLTATMRFDF